MQEPSRLVSAGNGVLLLWRMPGSLPDCPQRDKGWRSQILHLHEERERTFSSFSEQPLRHRARLLLSLMSQAGIRGRNSIGRGVNGSEFSCLIARNRRTSNFARDSGSFSPKTLSLTLSGTHAVLAQDKLALGYDCWIEDEMFIKDGYGNLPGHDIKEHETSQGMDIVMHAKHSIGNMSGAVDEM